MSPSQERKDETQQGGTTKNCPADSMSFEDQRGTDPHTNERDDKSKDLSSTSDLVQTLHYLCFHFVAVLSFRFRHFYHPVSKPGVNIIIFGENFWRGKWPLETCLSHDSPRNTVNFANTNGRVDWFGSSGSGRKTATFVALCH